MGGIDGETERGVPVGDGARDMIVDPGRVAAHIELEHAQRVGRRLGHAFEAGIADRAQHMGDAEFAGRLDHRRGALGMKAFQRADRAEHDRQPQLAAENFGRGIDLADVAQHARPERDRIERQAVAPQRRLGFDAADDIVPVVLVEILPRLGDDLVQVEEFIALRGGFRRRLRPISHWSLWGYALLVAGQQGTLTREPSFKKAQRRLNLQRRTSKATGPGTIRGRHCRSCNLSSSNVPLLVGSDSSVRR